MAYTYRSYRFATHSAYLAAWTAAGLPLAEGAPHLPGGALDEVGTVTLPDGTVLEGWHVNAAWPGAAPGALEAAAVPVFEGLRVFAGWSSAAPPAPVPEAITRRQFLLALLAAGMISAEEALAAASSGAVPAQVAAVFAMLPAEQALGARITWATMSLAERHHPLIAMMISAGLATSSQADELFRLGATL